MSGAFGSFFALLSTISMLLGFLALVALAVVAIAALLTWRRRLVVAIELDRLRIEQHVAGGGALPPEVR